MHLNASASAPPCVRSPRPEARSSVLVLRACSATRAFADVVTAVDCALHAFADSTLLSPSTACWKRFVRSPISCPRRLLATIASGGQHSARLRPLATDRAWACDSMSQDRRHGWTRAADRTHARDLRFVG